MVALASAIAAGCGGTSPGHGDATSGDGSYAAYAIVGGLDRLRVAKLRGDTCFEVQLVRPGTDGGGLALPAGWGFEQARALQPALACNPSYAGPIQNSFDASARAGSIRWQGNAVTTVDAIDVTLTFANAPAWCPASEALAATAVHVQ